jgi:hypothetical protein
MPSSGVKVPLSRVFRDRAQEFRTMAELFRSEKTREYLVNAAAEYESMADRAAMFELEDANRAAGSGTSILPQVRRLKTDDVKE